MTESNQQGNTALEKEIARLRSELQSNILTTEISRRDIDEIKKFHSEVGGLIRNLGNSLSRIDKVVEIQEINTQNSEERFNRRSDELKNLICELRKTTNASIDYIKKFQERADSEIEKRFNAIETEKIQPMEQRLTTLNAIETEKIQPMEQRLTTLERFRWVLLGGIVLGAWLIDKGLSYFQVF